MKTGTIVVTSLYPDIFAVCKESVDRFAGKRRKVLVIDADPELMAGVTGKHDTIGWEVVRVEMPYIGSVLGNVGMAAAYPDDILFMGDDVQLLCDVDRLVELAYSDSRIGILAPRVFGACGCALQRAGGKQFRDTWEETVERLAFICVYVKAAILAQVGFFDPRFVGYGGDDTDYCRRVQRAGYKLAVARDLHVKHGFGDSLGTMTWGRIGVDRGGSIIDMQLVLDKKWAHEVK